MHCQNVLSQLTNLCDISVGLFSTPVFPKMESPQLQNTDQIRYSQFNYENYLKELNLDDTMSMIKQSPSQEYSDESENIYQPDISTNESKNKDQNKTQMYKIYQKEPQKDYIEQSTNNIQNTKNLSSQLIQTDISQLQQDKLDVSKIQSVISEVKQQKQILRDLNSKQQQVYNDIKQYQVQEFQTTQSNLSNSNISDVYSSLHLSQSLIPETTSILSDSDMAINQAINTLSKQIQNINDKFALTQMNVLIDKIIFQFNVQKQLEYTFLPGNIKNIKQQNNEIIQMYHIFSENIAEAEEVLVRFFIRYIKQPEIFKSKRGIINMQKLKDNHNHEVNLSAVNFRIKHLLKNNISIIFNSVKPGIYSFSIVINDPSIKCEFYIIGGIIQQNVYYILDNTQSNRTLINQNMQASYREYGDTLVVICQK